MMQQISPIVRQLLILNVVVFILLQLAPDSLKTIGSEFFTVHKSNALGIHHTVNIYGEDILINPEFSKEEAQRQVDNNPELRKKLSREGQALNQFKPIQVVTYFFNHGGIMHILFNMLALFFLGPSIEQVLGGARFLRFYLFTGVFAGLALAFLDPSPYPVLGASTAVSGVMVAFALLYPRTKLYLMFLPIGIEARYMALGYGVISLVATVNEVINPGSGGNISHFGHLMGMVGAIIYFFLERFMPVLRK